MGFRVAEGMDNSLPSKCLAKGISLSDPYLRRTKEVRQQFDPKLNQPDGAIYLAGIVLITI